MPWCPATKWRLKQPRWHGFVQNWVYKHKNPRSTYGGRAAQFQHDLPYVPVQSYMHRNGAMNGQVPDYTKSHIQYKLATGEIQNIHKYTQNSI